MAVSIPLFQLGTILRPSSATHSFTKVIHLVDLSDNPLNLTIQGSKRKEEDHTRYLFFDKKALLIGGNALHPSFGYFEIDPEDSVGVSPSIFAFVPNEDLVSAEYVAVALAKKGILSTGSSRARISLYDLGMTQIPLLSKEDQKQAIKDFDKQQKNQYSQNASRPVKVVLMGDVPDLVDVNGRSIECVRLFNRISHTALGWLRGCSSKNYDAIIVKQNEAISDMDIFTLCTSFAPVFILTGDKNALEDRFADYAYKYLPGRCYSYGCEDLLTASLFRYVDGINNPKNFILEVYARQLQSAAVLDGKFRFNMCLHDKLEEILLSEGDNKEYLNDLRKIRDNCILKPLIKYGYLPETKENLTYGALVDLLANRIYPPQETKYILLQSFFPKNLSALLFASGPILNEGSHADYQADKDIQYVVLQIIMACICHMSKLINDGYFNSLDPTATRSQYIGFISEYVFESGKYLVQSIEENPGYLYAGNTHLDQKECAKQGIRPGDFVEIETMPIPEQHPKVTDYEKIFFYSKFFKKVVE